MNRPQTAKAYRTAFEAEQGSACHSLREQGPWHVPASLELKVTADGRMKPFWGDTTVMPVRDPDVLSALSGMQETLYASCGTMLAERLSPDTFHMTVHDLSNGPEREPLIERMAANESQVMPILEGLRGEVRMRATRVFPCMNISILLGLAPADETSFRRLMDAYDQLDALHSLNYWPRFHITLAYFLPQPVTDSAALAGTLSILNPPDLFWTTDLQDIEYQHFNDMNHYKQSSGREPRIGFE